MSTTDDQLLLQSVKNKERQIKKDERTIGKVEYVQDKLEVVDSKEQNELQKVETAKEYFRGVIRLADEQLERDKQRIQDAYENKIRYYREQLDGMEKKEEAIREKYDVMRERKMKKVGNLVNKIVSSKGKQLLNEVIDNPIVVPTIEKSERQKAVEWLEQNGHENYYLTQKLFPNYYRENQEILQNQESARKKSPQKINAEIAAENELIAADLKRQEVEKKLGSLNLAAQKAMREYKAAKAQQLSEERIEELLILSESARDEYDQKCLEFQRGIY